MKKSNNFEKIFNCVENIILFVVGYVWLWHLVKIDDVSTLNYILPALCVFFKTIRLIGNLGLWEQNRIVKPSIIKKYTKLEYKQEPLNESTKIAI